MPTRTIHNRSKAFFLIGLCSMTTVLAIGGVSTAETYDDLVGYDEYSGKYLEGKDLDKEQLDELWWADEDPVLDDWCAQGFLAAQCLDGIDLLDVQVSVESTLDGLYLIDSKLAIATLIPDAQGDLCSECKVDERCLVNGNDGTAICLP